MQQQNKANEKEKKKMEEVTFSHFIWGNWERFEHLKQTRQTFLVDRMHYFQ